MDEKQPFVSICTPVYNGEKFLEQCIKGVLAQRHSNFEYIIVDNASTDRTPEIIEKYRVQDSRIKVIRNESTVPVIDNFNTCAANCSDNAIWVKYALADDYLFPSCVEEMLAVGEQSEDIGMVSAYRLYGGQLTNSGLPVEQSIFKGSDILKQQLLRKLHVCSGSPNTVMYRKSAFDGVDRFDNTYLHADTELAMRLLERYDLGFAHCVFTQTGLHGARGETRSIYNGVIYREYMDFGFRNLDRYKRVEFSENEKDELAGFYAKQVDSFLAKKLAHFDFKNISVMLEGTPEPIKTKLLSVFLRSPIKYSLDFLREAKTAVRSAVSGRG